MATASYNVGDVQGTKVRKRHLELLEPYLVGEQPRDDGEWDMYCPLHDDNNRSAQLNVQTGVWFCHATCGGGRVTELIAQRDDWVPPRRGGGGRSASSNNNGNAPAEEITEAKVAGWVEALQSEPEILEAFQDRRALTNETILQYEIGWDRTRKAYTIPVRGHEGEFWNVRRYQLDPSDDRRKIWGVKGMNEVRLYPVWVLATELDYIIICEGELDALVLNQHGYPAITRTGAAKVWQGAWNEYFKGKTVYLCHDTDDAGRDGTRKVGRSLSPLADVRVVALPYEHTEKHGKDVTDFFQEHEPDEFRELLDQAKPWRQREAEETEDLDPADASVLDSFDSRRVGKPLALTVTVKGRAEQGYSLPQKFRLTCTRDKGHVCNFCPMNGAGGEATDEITPDDPAVLEMMDASKAQVWDTMREHYGVPIKCAKLDIEVEQHQAVEVLYARPSVEHMHGDNGSGGADDYRSVRLTSVGRHDTSANNTVRAVGALHPDPRKQSNQFLAWEVEPVATALDDFRLDKKTAKKLKRFQPRPGQRPLKKLGEISRELSAHVTHIYGRPEMHALIDLVVHSVLSFNFAGQHVPRGWVEGIIVGDTRTGKSEASTKLSRHYGVGEVVSCESASFAGVIGGLQQYGATKEWAVTWGVVPLNDRRWVVLDEVGGLTPEQIAEMSDVRSRGLAQLTKIQTEATPARTRLLWLGNPRNTRMSGYTYGVQALRPLIGNDEDIARFDIAMSVAAGEVSPDEINRQHERDDPRYTAKLCQALVRWVWSRTPDQVHWASGAEAAVFKAAQQMGKRYVEDPPLVQGANVRIKIARIAVAMAARLFSTDDGERIVVTKQHVRDAVAFIDRVYGMTNFGYLELSTERLGDQRLAEKKRDDIRSYLRNKKGLAKFLRTNSKFRRQDLEEILNIQREEANAIINRLWDARMVRKENADVRVEPTLHTLLREVK